MSRRGLAAALALIPIVLAAAGLRSVTAGYVLSGPAVRFYGNDAYYHARRVALLQQGEVEAAFTRDPFLNYPHGAVAPWPPGFDALLVGLAGLLGGADRDGRDAALALGMPLLGALAVVLLYLLGMALYRDRTIALIAAGLMAGLPAAAGTSLLGRVDHHALIPVVVLLFALAVVRAGQAECPWRRTAWTGVAALAASAAFLSWPATPWLYLGLPLGAAVLGHALWLRQAGPEAGFMAAGARRFSALAAALWVAVIVVYLVLRQLPPERAFDLSALSRFTQYAAFGLAMVATAALGDSLRTRPGWPGWAVFPGFVGVIGLFMHVPLLLKLSSGVGAVGQLAATDPLIAGLSESQPLLADPLNAIEQYTGLLLLVPAALVLPLLRPPARAARDASVLVGCLAIPLFLLTLVQQRFGEVFAPLYCLCLAVVLAGLFRGASRLAAGRRGGGGSKQRRGYGILTVLGLALVLALAPAASAYQRGLQTGEGPGTAITELCGRWFPDAPQNGQGTPAFGAYAAWSRGNQVLYRCGLAPVANPMATPDLREGIARVARITLSEEDDPAAGLGGDVRYWFVYPPAPAVRFYAELLGEDADQYAAPDPGQDPEGRLTQAYFSTTVARLAHFDGATMRFQGRVYPTVPGFRLLGEAGPPLRPGPGPGRLVKLYQRVAGARLTGRAAPGEAVRIRARIQLPGGREFEYLDRTVAGADGRWARRVPYPVGPPADGGRARAPYWVQVGETAARAVVTAEAVHQGLDLEVALPQPEEPAPLPRPDVPASLPP